MENKYEITKKLEELLKLCRLSVASAEYVQEGYDEYVIVTHENGYKRKVCVTCDSGKAMIMDVVKEVR